MGKNTKQKAISAARELFKKKGKDGVRMQEVADKAGINKGLLHYYFKSKDKLFQEVYAQEFKKVYPDVVSILNTQHTLEQKLDTIIEACFALSAENPGLASSVLFEINKPGKGKVDMAKDLKLEKAVELLDLEFRNNHITSSPQFALQVLLNIFSLCVHPFMMKPIFQKSAKQLSGEMEAFMEERKAFLKQIIIGSFRP